MDGNYLCVSTQFEAPGAEQFQPHASRDVRTPESFTQVKALQVDPDTGHALLVQLMVASVELLQLLHQGLLPAMDLGLMLPGVDVFCIGCLLYLEQLVSWNHHPGQFKGTVVLIKSEIPLSFDGFIVTSHTTWWLLPICSHWAPLKSRCLVGLQVACTFCGTSCGWTWLLPSLCLSMWGNPQLLTPYQSRWHSPMSHCLIQTPQHHGWLLPHWQPWWSLSQSHVLHEASTTTPSFGSVTP